MKKFFQLRPPAIKRMSRIGRAKLWLSSRGMHNLPLTGREENGRLISADEAMQIRHHR